MAYSYACRDYPGMESCPGQFTSESAEELWKHIELHASEAHEEDPTSWPADEIAKVKALIR